MAVDPREDIHGFFSLHPLQKPSDRLKVSVTAFDVMEVVDLAVNEVKVYLRRAYNRTRNRRYVPDTIRRFVRQYFEIVSYSHCSNY